ncbi:hypothetical protein [Niabella drilacis]|uniref:Tetratricopeptide repeat-containing protein n=1 Tax=Niabella drilacis (strain DSM 25811 / CCM 8410 / CCUG 62505 / LMG 26954 / E90) TaxID=1285928 RepID=A0A1G6WVX9_NIADE|nr:hypothetical protein [Niabella drilacis]SDD69954.1 hypothetical protein SAMN04487894_11244 [Niabella drilacis]
MMKKTTLFASVLLLGSAAYAQKYDPIKGVLLANNLAEAHKLYDKESSNEKFFSKPEGYIIKSYILAFDALDSAKAGDAEKNREAALAAFNKYKEMDPSMKDLDTYKNAPYQLYASYFNSGVADINAKNYEAAYAKFKNVVDLSDLLIAKKINLPGPIDTNAVYYAGVLAETNKQIEDAVKYNTRLADLKITGHNFEQVYQSLVRYYAGKNDDANFEKYRKLGKELYPQSEFFNYSKLEFAIGGSSNFDEKVAALEKIVTATPDDYKANLALGEAIFERLNRAKDGEEKPANAVELETKMLGALKKAESLNAAELQPVLLLGDHFMAKASIKEEEMRNAEKEVDAKGTKATAADKQKSADAKKAYIAEYALAVENFEKAADALGKLPQLDNVQKRQYRVIAGNLAQYYFFIGQDATGANKTKYNGLEKKYDTLYKSMK